MSLIKLEYNHRHKTLDLLSFFYKSLCKILVVIDFFPPQAKLMLMANHGTQTQVGLSTHPYIKQTG